MNICIICIYIYMHHTGYVVLSMYLCIYVSIYLSTYLPTFLSTYLSTYLPIYLSTYLPIYLSTYLPIYLSTYLPIYQATNLPIYLSIHPSIYLSIYLYIYSGPGQHRTRWHQSLCAQPLFLEENPPQTQQPWNHRNDLPNIMLSLPCCWFGTIGKP